MAQKRMFDKRVIESDKFTDLPNSSKALYFMAGMSADDKGFFQPRRLQKICGFADDDFKILLAKGFFIAFESGVMVVTDWNKNNWLDSRRITETEYVDELKLLKLVNEKYELIDDNSNNAKPMLSENSIEENSIVENNINIYSVEFETIWKQYPKKIGKQNALKDYIKARKKGTTYEEVINGLNKYLEYCANTKWYSPKDGSTWFHKKSWEDELEVEGKETEEEWIERMEREIKEKEENERKRN